MSAGLGATGGGSPGEVQGGDAQASEASLLGRVRRAVTRPAGPPAAGPDPQPAASESAHPDAANDAQAGPGEAGATSMSAAGSGSKRASGGRSSRAAGSSRSRSGAPGGSAGSDGPASAETGSSADSGSDTGATESGAADQAGADQAGADKGSADKGSADKGSADKGSADKASADKASADEGAPAKSAGRSRRTSSRRPKAETAAAETTPTETGSAGGLPAVVMPPAAVPQVAAAAEAASAEPGATPTAAFQPPLVIFQAPDMSVVRAPTAKPVRPAVAEQDEVEVDEAGADEAKADQDQSDEAESGSASGRRRRRGGRGRGKGQAREAGETTETGHAADDEAAEAEPGADTQASDDGDADQAGSVKRRRRRRRGVSGTDGEAGPGTDDPPNTVVHVRPAREKDKADLDDVKAVKGSTRLEAKRQRRREGRESGRRRPPIITESEFLARREAVERIMVVRQHADRTQIAVLEDGVLVEHYVDKASHQSYVGNVYLGKVQNVLPSMEAAFVDIGKGRNAVLYAGEVNFDASGLEGDSKRIESALKSGQSILVQVTKDPIGHKGARLTSQVSLPGRYLVYVPGASMTGISRKLPDTERSRLKQILKQVMPENAGVIVRTAAEGASEEELSRDVSRLAAQWEAIEKKSKTASAPDLLYSEPDLTLRVIRDIFNEDFSNLVVASDNEWDMVDEYVRYVAPHLADRMQRWDDGKDVFGAYRVDEQLAKALERKVWLPSGGSLVIDHTEAMTVIDVNTGKFTGQGGNLEQTVTRNNLEAAEEIVRQLRLRDLGGIIVIDFIDMVLESNRELVLRRLLECLARDRTKHQVAEVTSLGLVQMTRKRVGSGLLEAFSVPCEHCNGRGVIVSMEPVDHSHGHEVAGRGQDGGSRGGRTGRSNGRAADGGQRRGGQQASGGASADSSGAARADEGDGQGDGQAPSVAVGVATVSAASGSRRGSRSRAGRPAGPPAPIADPAGQPATAGAAAGDSPQAAGADSGTAEAPAGGIAANGTVPDGTALEGTAPEGTAPDGTAAEGTAPGSAATNGAQSGTSRSGRSRSSRSRRASADAAASQPASEPAGDQHSTAASSGDPGAEASES
ncbi:MAG TPA: Rne/Rng family ribonuclease [Streptosporangiaceae bacterium]